MIEDKGSETTDAGSPPVTCTHTDAKLKIYQFLPHASEGGGRSRIERADRTDWEGEVYIHTGQYTCMCQAKGHEERTGVSGTAVLQSGCLCQNHCLQGLRMLRNLHLEWDAHPSSPSSVKATWRTASEYQKYDVNVGESWLYWSRVRFDQGSMWHLFSVVPVSQLGLHEPFSASFFTVVELNLEGCAFLLQNPISSISYCEEKISPVIFLSHILFWVSFWETSITNKASCHF